MVEESELYSAISACSVGVLAAGVIISWILASNPFNCVFSSSSCCLSVGVALPDFSPAHRGTSVVRIKDVRAVVRTVIWVLA